MTTPLYDEVVELTGIDPCKDPRSPRMTSRQGRRYRKKNRKHQDQLMGTVSPPE